MDKTDNIKNTTISDEFDFLMEEEDTSTYEDKSNEYIQQAYRFIDFANSFPDKTWQGIITTSIKNCLTIGKTATVPWEHVGFTLDINKLKDVSGERLRELSIPSFVEELESIGNRNNSGFGYNDTFRNNLKTVFIPSSVAVIAYGTFALYKKLEKVVFEENSNLLSLGEQAFACCENLKSLDLSNCIYLDKLSGDTFINSSIKRLKLPSSIKYIKDSELLTDSTSSKIEFIYIDNEKYTAEQFRQNMEQFSFKQTLNNIVYDTAFWDNSEDIEEW